MYVKYEEEKKRQEGESQTKNVSSQESRADQLANPERERRVECSSADLPPEIETMPEEQKEESSSGEEHENATKSEREAGIHRPERLIRLNEKFIKYIDAINNHLQALIPTNRSG